MAHQFDATLVREPLMCGLEHWLDDIETNADAVGSGQPQQGEQASITRAEVEDPPGVARHVIRQDTLTLGAVRERICSGEVAERMLWVPPLAHRTVDHRGIMRVGAVVSLTRLPDPAPGVLLRRDSERPSKDRAYARMGRRSRKTVVLVEPPMGGS